MFLPDPRRRGEIHFVLAKTMPYNRRMAVIFILVAAGLLLQGFVHVAAGVPVLLAASMLGMVKGYTNIPRGPFNNTQWRAAKREQLMQIMRIDRASRNWDQSALDITCSSGCFAFALMGLLTFMALVMLTVVRRPYLAATVGLDAAVLLAPHWFSGVRTILKNDPLTVKCRQLLNMMDFYQTMAKPGESLVPQLLVRVGDKCEIPTDAKLVLNIEKLGKDFLGMQVQVVLNNVQGSDYPYLYCVLVARPALQMDRYLAPAELGITVESKSEPSDNVDIIVIRQTTTSTSGYYTDAGVQQAVFGAALMQARALRAPRTPLPSDPVKPPQPRTPPQPPPLPGPPAQA